MNPTAVELAELTRRTNLHRASDRELRLLVDGLLRDDPEFHDAHGAGCRCPVGARSEQRQAA